MSENSTGNGEIMKNIIIGLTTMLVGVFGGTAVAGNDTTATSVQINKIEKIADNIHKIDKNTSVLVVKVGGIEYRLNQMDSRIADLEKNTHKKN